MSVSWSTATDWDNYQSQSHVSHTSDGDKQADRLQIGNDVDSASGYWPLDESSGDALDYSANSNDGTVTGATQGVTGTFGTTAYSFDGVDDYILCNASIPNNGDFTVMMWNNANATQAGYQRIMGSWRGMNGNGDVYFYTTTTFGSATDQIRFWTDEQGEIVVGSDIRGAGWTHIALTRSGDVYTLYEDATQVDTATVTGALLPSAAGLDTQRFGSGRDERYHEGKLDEIITMNTALTQSQISDYQGLTGNYVTGVQTL